MTTDNSTAPAQGLTEALNALKPFAALAKHYPTTRTFGNRPTTGIVHAVAGKDGVDGFTVEDLHAAAAAVELIGAALAAAPHTAAQPVARVDSWANGSYGRNYRLTWLKDVSEGSLLYAAPVVQPAQQMRKVFLVCTGEVYEGQETYTRHDDAPPPMCDFEMLLSPFEAAPASDADSMPAQPTKEN